MNLNNYIENDVLSRSIINADANGCSNTFGTLSSSKDMVGNNLNERFKENNTVVNTMNNVNKKPLEVLLSSEISDNVDKHLSSNLHNSNSLHSSLVDNNITLLTKTNSFNSTLDSRIKSFQNISSINVSNNYYMSSLILIVVIFMLTILLMLM
jgi:hypothetical protein